MKYILRSLDGKRYYSFAGGCYYDGPQFSTDIRNAKIFTLRGASNVKGRLANRKYYGEDFEVIQIEEDSFE